MPSPPSARPGPDLLSYVVMALLTAAFAWLAFFWWFCLGALFEQGPCGTRYGGTQCGAGTGWRIVVLVFATPLLMFAVGFYDRAVYGPERRGHEAYRVVLLGVPLVGLAQLLGSEHVGFWQVAGAVLCVAAVAGVVVWTTRTIGARGAYWLMAPGRLSALGPDSASRRLSFAQNTAFLAANAVGGCAGTWVARLTDGLLS